MRQKLGEPEATGIGISALASIIVAGLLASVRAESDQANAALILSLVVIVAAATGGRRAGAVTSVVAAVSFDFFLTRPYLSLAITGTDEVITTVLLLIVGLAVGQIATSRHAAPSGPGGVSRDRRRTALVLADHLAPTLAARGAQASR